MWERAGAGRSATFLRRSCEARSSARSPSALLSCSQIDDGERKKPLYCTNSRSSTTAHPPAPSPASPFFSSSGPSSPPAHPPPQACNPPPSPSPSPPPRPQAPSAPAPAPAPQTLRRSTPQLPRTISQLRREELPKLLLSIPFEVVRRWSGSRWKDGESSRELGEELSEGDEVGRGG